MTENTSLFPTLGPDDIECRVQSTAAQHTGVFAVLLLYIDARAAMTALDNAYGTMGWQRSHQMIGDRLYCTIAIKDDKTGEWITKQDVGIESAAQPEKGQASDAFKRACVNVGIGRELYTAPTIKIQLLDGEYDPNSNRPKVKPWIKFKVKDIQYDDRRRITSVVIVDQRGRVRYPAASATQMATRAPEEQRRPVSQAAPQKPAQAPQAGALTCSACGVAITAAEADYSSRVYKRALCRACQKRVGGNT